MNRYITLHCAATPNGKPFDIHAIDTWNAALYALRDIRLKGKEAVKAADTAADAQAAAASAEAQIKAVLDQVAQ